MSARTERREAVDEAAVIRAMAGDPTVRLNMTERRVAVQRLREQGVTQPQVCELLGLDTQQVHREWSADPVEQSGGGGLPMRESMRSPVELKCIPLDLIDEHPANVRETLGDEDLLELAESIRTVGLLQPIVVAPKGGGRYEILAGHRRYAALMLTTEQSVNCVVRTRRPERAEALELMLVENLHRRTLNPIEEANAYDSLRLLGKSQQQIAEQVGVSQFTVSSRLSLLELPDDIQREIATRVLSISDGYEMVRAARARINGRANAPRKNAKGIAFPARSVPHFNARHPLAATAGERCDDLSHSRRLQIGPACGACWEKTIREDERGQVGVRKERAS